MNRPYNIRVTSAQYPRNNDTAQRPTNTRATAAQRQSGIEPSEERA